VVVVLVCGETELMSWRLDDGVPVDLSVVDHLARLQLAARRVGCSVRLRSPGSELLGLLDLVGLGDVVLELPLRKASGEAEGGEEGGIEEVVVTDDPVA